MLKSVAVGIAAIISGVITAGIGLSVVTGDGCYFDPPPGDFGSISIINDTSQTVTVFDCDSSSCTSGENQAPIASGHTYKDQYELCGGYSLGIKRPDGTPIGCLILPIGDPAKVDHVYVSDSRRC